MVKFVFYIHLYTMSCLRVFVQLQTLISKKGAVSPLYLHLACEDLRNFASFDKVQTHCFSPLLSGILIYVTILI